MVVPLHPDLILKKLARKDRFLEPIFFVLQITYPDDDRISGHPPAYEQLFITNVHKVLICFTLENLEKGLKYYILVSWF